MAGVPIRSPQIAWPELERIAPLRRATAQDEVAGAAPQFVVEPRSEEEAAQVLRWASAVGVAVVPRGGATKLEWGNPPRAAELVISTRALNRVVEHAWADMTATVEAGCSVADFQKVLAERRQRLAIDPLWPERATIGGMLASNDSGSLRVRFGSLRDLIIGITIALPDGTLARSGGKVVKNVAGYDLPKLFTGSLGTLGVITQAIFRLHPLPHSSRTLSFTVPNADAATKLILAVQDSTLAHTGSQVRLVPGAPIYVDIRLEGIPPGIEAQSQQLLKIAASAQPVEAADAWSARQRLWEVTDALMGKLSILPTQIGAACALLDDACGPQGTSWSAVIQAPGVGTVRLEGDPEKFAAAVQQLRSGLQWLGGHFVVLRCPSALRRRIDAWGSGGMAEELMRRVKQQFDPAGILNPGRFLGGI